MICLRCHDMHAGNDLAYADHGITLTLGDCPKGGARHEWRAAHFIIDMPMIFDIGDYKVRKVTVDEAYEFVRSPHVMSCLKIPFNSQLLSRLLDIPLIYHKRVVFRMDVGDRALAPLGRMDARMADAHNFQHGEHYDLVVLERVA